MAPVAQAFLLGRKLRCRPLVDRCRGSGFLHDGGLGDVSSSGFRPARLRLDRGFRLDRGSGSIAGSGSAVASTAFRPRPRPGSAPSSVRASAAREASMSRWRAARAAAVSSAPGSSAIVGSSARARAAAKAAVAVLPPRARRRGHRDPPPRLLWLERDGAAVGSGSTAGTISGSGSAAPTATAHHLRRLFLGAVLLQSVVDGRLRASRRRWRRSRRQGSAIGSSSASSPSAMIASSTRSIIGSAAGSFSPATASSNSGDAAVRRGRLRLKG